MAAKHAFTIFHARNTHSTDTPHNQDLVLCTVLRCSQSLLLLPQGHLHNLHILEIDIHGVVDMHLCEITCLGLAVSSVFINEDGLKHQTKSIKDPKQIFDILGNGLTIECNS